MNSHSHDSYSPPLSAAVPIPFGSVDSSLFNSYFHSSSLNQQVHDSPVDPPHSSSSLYSRVRQVDSDADSQPLISSIELTARVDNSLLLPQFVAHFNRELTRVNDEFLVQLRLLDSRSQLIDQPRLDLPHSLSLTHSQHSADGIKSHLIEFYRDLINLQNFVAFNGVAFQQILNRAANAFAGQGAEANAAIESATRQLENSEFFTSSDGSLNLSSASKRKSSFGRAASLNDADVNRLSFMVRHVESSFASLYCCSNTLLAHNLLHENIRSVDASSRPAIKLNWQTFDLGMRFGIFLLLLIWLLWDVIVDARLRPSHAPIWVKSVLPVYRGIGVLLFFGWLYGCNLWIWRHFRLNYLAVFDLDSHSTLNHSQVFLKCLSLSTAFLVNFLIYFKMLRGDFPEWIPSGALPVSLFLYFVYSLAPQRNRKSQIFSAFVEVYRAPFGKVTFLTTYVGDVITSLVRPTVDIAYSICFILSFQWLQDIDEPTSEIRFAHCLHSPIFKRFVVPILSALPLWLRLMQCLRKYMETKKRWPFLGNALKYGLSHSIVLFSVMHATIQDVHYSSASKNIFYLSFIISTLYAFFWDVYMDWNLGWQKFGFLRETMIYQNPTIYYSCIGIDFLLRFSWTLTLIPQGEDSLLPGDFILFLQPFLAAAEVFRRCMWGCFRVEHEHFSTQQSQAFTNKEENETKIKFDERTGRQQIIEVILIAGLVLSLGLVAVVTAN